MIVEAYVSTASPVGSELVARKFRPSLSSATIRHVMVELEEAGLIEQPHTSAGRVPTQRGYRYYVDAVMEIRPLPAEQVRQMESLLQPAELDVEHLLDRASEVLAGLTQQVAFAVAPTMKRTAVKQIELLPLSVRKVLCVLVANEEMIAAHVVEVEEPLSREEAAALARFINTELAGLPGDALLESLERRLLAESDLVYHLVRRSFDILRLALSTEPEERLFLDGTSYVMSQPEFSRDPRKAHELLKGLDEASRFLQRVREDLAADGVRVRIGREVQVPGLEECSTVTAPVAVGHTMVGAVGVLGPIRMDYPRVRALVETMAQCAGELLARWDAAR